ncbi:hypothetical protein [Niallia oryzisoli]|uniref:hypothetical protein n=1 Tax=Niallia oryzisoli TaxID=1737571 RepID=UPI003734C312
MKNALIEDRKGYVFKTERGYIGKLSPRKTEIGTLHGITEFKEVKRAEIFEEEKGAEIEKAKADFQRYIDNINHTLECIGEKALELELINLETFK